MRPTLLTTTFLLGTLLVAAFGAPDGSWESISSDGAPAPRSAHSTVWTGTELIVWGGQSGEQWLGDGAAYHPGTNSWRALPKAGAPSPRAWHSAVWTGTEMIVWGGCDEDRDFPDGASYDPAEDRWQALPSAGAPPGRVEHSAVWTGTEMVVWSGVTDERSFTDGARYDPVARTWRHITGPEVPFGRRAHAAVWTGREMVVWGGINGSSVLPDGFRYDPKSDRWTPLPTENAPAACGYPGAVWAGDRLLIFGGRRDIYGNTASSAGAAWDPDRDRWTPLPTEGGPPARHGHAVLWTGSELLVWGGATGRLGRGAKLFGDGWAFHPAKGKWRDLSSAPEFGGRARAACAWSGSAMILWGGEAEAPLPLGDGMIFRP